MNTHYDIIQEKFERILAHKVAKDSYQYVREGDSISVSLADEKVILAILNASKSAPTRRTPPIELPRKLNI
jgi:hypothetical protein